MTGTATYAGTVNAQAQDAGSAMRNVGGGFTETWCFQCRSGSIAINVDNKSLSAPLGVSPNNSVGFTGNFTGSLPESVNGAFATSPGQAPGSVPAGVAGNFSASGSGYVLGGAFGGSLKSVR